MFQCLNVADDSTFATCLHCLPKGAGGLPAAVRAGADRTGASLGWVAALHSAAIPIAVQCMLTHPARGQVPAGTGTGTAEEEKAEEEGEGRVGPADELERHRHTADELDRHAMRVHVRMPIRTCWLDTHGRIQPRP